MPQAHDPVGECVQGTDESEQERKWMPLARRVASGLDRYTVTTQMTSQCPTVPLRRCGVLDADIRLLERHRDDALMRFVGIGANSRCDNREASLAGGASALTGDGSSFARFDQ
jgi:hypothetical protein